MTNQSQSHKTPAISVTGVSNGYPGLADVIEGITFDVLRGERIGVLGPNGAGKSTLFRSIAGLMPTRRGEILIHGHSHRDPLVTVGFVPQSDQVDWNFPATVREVVMMGRTKRIGWFQRAQRSDWEMVDYLIEKVGMSRFRERQIGQLSGGQRRRVFIARALAQETDVLLLDEPFSGIDKAAEDEILTTLDRLSNDGVTMLLATHDLHMATTAFDRVLMINHNLIAYDVAENLFTPDILRETFGGQVGIIVYGGRDYVVMHDAHT